MERRSAGREAETHVPDEVRSRRVADGGSPCDQLSGAPSGGSDPHGSPAADGPETPAGHGDDRHVYQREGDIGGRVSIEGENHAPGGSQEANAESASKGRQSGGVGVDDFLARRG